MSSTENNIIPMFGVTGVKDALVDIKSPQQYLSFYDLNQVLGFKSAKETNNKAELERILFENGADISKPYKLEKCQHRPRTSPTPYFGFRLVFTERTDKAWRHSGACSMEAYCHTEDSSLTRELLSLDPRAARKGYDAFEDEVETGLDLSLLEAGEDCV
jgi:hypothetical protein